MNPQTFLVITRAMGHGANDLADRFNVNRRTVSRWFTTINPPAEVEAAIMDEWEAFINRVEDVLESAEALEHRGLPVVLNSIADEQECMVISGMPRDQHTALLGLCALALDLQGYDWQIEPRP